MTILDMLGGVSQKDFTEVLEQINKKFRLVQKQIEVLRKKQEVKEEVKKDGETTI